MLKATMLPDAMPVIRVLETQKMASGLKQLGICFMCSKGIKLSETSDHVTGPWLECQRHSRDKRTAA